MTLSPGDVTTPLCTDRSPFADSWQIVLTGTPKGVGPVVDGDVMEGRLYAGDAEIEDARIEVACEDRVGGYEFRE